MPALILPERFRKALWVIMRNDAAGYVTWEEHSQKPEFGGQPVTCLLVWTGAELAERYAAEALKGTGRPMPIEKNQIVPFLRKIRSDTRGRVNWVILNKPPEAASDVESFRTGIAEIPVLVEYLTRGGEFGGQEGHS